MSEIIDKKNAFNANCNQFDMPLICPPISQVFPQSIHRYSVFPLQQSEDANGHNYLPQPTRGVSSSRSPPPQYFGARSHHTKGELVHHTTRKLAHEKLNFLADSMKKVSAPDTRPLKQGAILRRGYPKNGKLLSPPPPAGHVLIDSFSPLSQEVSENWNPSTATHGEYWYRFGPKSGDSWGHSGGLTAE